MTTRYCLELDKKMMKNTSYWKRGLKNHKLYGVIFVVPDRTEYNHYLPIAQQVIQSIKIEPTNEPLTISEFIEVPTSTGLSFLIALI